ncbi:Cell division cycle-related protein [Lachnellula hyalina]|uniref:Cell division cycle-related protein n=1 Tax=Lachnellula hyalina TaxID=1316788 RepID=A0A8H8R7B1_9HELO|nr:Cell division cycle-related protein [Lachnellula hyalina]TVY29679.1 Cell division cycle-related protein [Lachnellula hyalina]
MYAELAVVSSIFSQLTTGKIPVYEYQFGEGLKEHVMRRRHDDWINATHILKAAGFDKPARTRILEREVQKENHEKVQGGYGKYQGTWVSLEQGEALAQRNNVYEKLRPIFEFIPGNISPPPAPKHTTNKPKVPKKPAVPKWGSMAPPARVIEDEYDNISAQLNDDESLADDVTVASASFMAEDDRYDMSRASTGHRKRKREENAQNAIDAAHVMYSDELLDYFMVSSDSDHVPKPEPPLNFQPDWIIDQDRHSAIHWAAAMGDVEIMRELRKFGANLAAQNVRGETPLMRAVLFTNCKDKGTMPIVVKELMSTVSCIDFCQATVLHHTAAVTVSSGKHKCARYYLDILLNKMQEELDPEHFQRVLDAQDVDGNTAIHIAAKNGARKCVRALMGRSPTMEIQNKDGVTAEILIQELNENTLRELRENRHAHAGSSSPFLPPNFRDNGDQIDNRWMESYETPPPSKRQTPTHHSEAAMSVQQKVAPQMLQKFQELANSFDEELIEKNNSEKEARRIVNSTEVELSMLREQVLDLGFHEEDAETQAKKIKELAHLTQLTTSLIEQQQQMQLLSSANREESKSNGNITGDDDIMERATLAKMLNEEQTKRRVLVLRYLEALSKAGGLGEKGDLYKRLLALCAPTNEEMTLENMDILIEQMSEEQKGLDREIFHADEV